MPSPILAIALHTANGCAALKATGGEAALALLRRTDDVDLVLVDLAISDMDGIAAAVLILKTARDRDMPIVPLATSRDDLRCRAVGFAGAVLKPYSPRQLHAAMKAALDPQRTAARPLDA